MSIKHGLRCGLEDAKTLARSIPVALITKKKETEEEGKLFN